MKAKLFLKREGEDIEEDISNDKNELVESIYKEIANYSLTPRNTINRTLQFNTQKDIVDEGELVFSNTIPKKSKTKLFALSKIKGQTKDLVIETAKAELENEFFNQVKEQSYIENYNQILEIYNTQEKVPCTFIDKCLGVIRHGINIHVSTNIANSYNHILNKIIESQDQTLNNLEGQSKKGSDKGSKKSGTQQVSDSINFKILHPLEVSLLADAITNALQNQHKAILIDIFERSKDGLISIDEETNKPKTHTIVLCRKNSIVNKEDFTFLIIDPSNSEFSQHLNMLGVNKIISSSLKQNIQIETSAKLYKIYEQNSKIIHNVKLSELKKCVNESLLQHTKNTEKFQQGIELVLNLCKEHFNLGICSSFKEVQALINESFKPAKVKNIKNEKEWNDCVEQVLQLCQKYYSVGTGLAFNKFRDCIDIAFKFTLAIKDMKEIELSFSSLDNIIFDQVPINKIIAAITNNKNYDSTIDPKMCTTNFLDYPFRGKQLTAIEKREEFYEKQIELYKSLLSSTDHLDNQQVLEKVDSLLKALLNNSQIDTIELSKFIKTFNHTILQQNEIQKMWLETVSTYNGIQQEEVELLANNLNENFTSYYNEI
jgi:hypothetical protein